MAVCNVTFNTAAPSGAPTTFTTSLILSTNITVQWGRVSCRKRNSEISNYTLRHSLADGSEKGQREVNVSGVGDSDRMYTVTRLHPDSPYTLTIAAVNTNGQKGPNISINVTTDTPESKILTFTAENHTFTLFRALLLHSLGVVIQLQLIGVHTCIQWRVILKYNYLLVLAIVYIGMHNIKINVHQFHTFR